jgi:hypothetical protein
LKWPDEDIVVFLEDDYLFNKNWIQYIKEGLQFADYVTLYDHPDKYTNMYSTLVSKLFKGTIHWRTTPSTTNSYACLIKTLRDDYDIHWSFCQGNGVTLDHQKFLSLWKLGKSLISSIPAFWSHEEMFMQCKV